MYHYTVIKQQHNFWVYLLFLIFKKTLISSSTTQCDNTTLKKKG